MKDFITRSEKETEEFCSSIVKLISLPSVININGDLGTGKTFISKNIARQFDHPNITSSSFQKVTYYYGKVRLIHCDFYKNGMTDNFFYSEIEPLLEGRWLLLIEWCTHFPFELNAQKIVINIKHIYTERSRQISTTIEN
jgi:tRNA threonylcarbamoyl adenosine modification protein YjeE